MLRFFFSFVFSFSSFLPFPPPPPPTALCTEVSAPRPLRPPRRAAPCPAAGSRDGGVALGGGGEGAAIWESPLPVRPHL